MLLREISSGVLLVFINRIPSGMEDEELRLSRKLQN